MLASLAWKYCLLVFIAVLGVLQGAAARNNLRGLLFFRYRTISYVFMGVALGFSLYFFFTWNTRYATGVIEGSQQAGFFTLAALGAIFFTAVVTSVVKSAYFKRQTFHPRGFEALKKDTMFHILRDKIMGKRYKPLRGRANGRH